jgi:hypothetical protein
MLYEIKDLELKINKLLQVEKQLQSIWFENPIPLGQNFRKSLDITPNQKPLKRGATVQGGENYDEAKVYTEYNRGIHLFTKQGLATSTEPPVFK